MLKAINFNCCFSDKGRGESPSFCSESRNLKADEGVFKDGFTVKAATFGTEQSRVTLPEGITPSGIFSADVARGKVVLISGFDEKKGTYAVCALDTSDPEGGFKQLEGCDPESPMFASAALYGSRVAVFADAAGRLFSYDGSSVKKGSCPVGARDIISFGGRLAVITDEAVYLSSSNNPFSFAYSDSTTFYFEEGMCARRAAVFGNELIIAGNRGLARLVKYDYNSSFYLRTIYTEGERLYPETLACGADKAFVMSDRGLAAYNGAGVDFSYAECAALCAEGVCGFISGGGYYACVKTAQNAQKQLVLAFESGGWYAVSESITAASSNADGTGNVLLCSRRYVCADVGIACVPFQIKRLVSCLTDFGRSGRKTLTELSLKTDKTLTVIIEADGKRHAYKITGGRGNRILRPYLSAEEFKFELLYEGIGVNISDVCATVEL